MRFTIFMEPVAKARVRAKMVQGKIRTFTPTGTEVAEWKIQQKVGQQVLIEGPVRLEIELFIQKPKSVSKKRTMPTTKPDWDNYGKLVSDSLNGFAYRDDAQVTTAIVRKRYGTPPRIEIWVEEDSYMEANNA